MRSLLDPERPCDKTEPHEPHIWHYRGVAFVCRNSTPSSDALRALSSLTVCRCEPAWTERALHNTHCLSDYREDVDALRAAFAMVTEERDRRRLTGLRLRLARFIHPYRTQQEIDAAKWRGHEKWIEMGFGVKHDVDEPCPAKRIAQVHASDCEWWPDMGEDPRHCTCGLIASPVMRCGVCGLEFSAGAFLDHECGERAR